jgi:mono/diheme cytochrome c family protein
MLKLLAGVILGIVLLLAAAFLFLTRGGMPIAASGKPLPLEQFIAHAALENAIGKEADKVSPLSADERNLAAGARLYRANCAVCHGLPEQPLSPIARGMFPPPPRLFPGKGVSDDPVGETYWKVRNGIRHTGMPGFAGSLSEAELWQVSLLLAKSDQLSPPVRQQLAVAAVPR